MLMLRSYINKDRPSENVPYRLALPSIVQRAVNVVRDARPRLSFSRRPGPQVALSSRCPRSRDSYRCAEPLQAANTTPGGTRRGRLDVGRLSKSRPPKNGETARALLGSASTTRRRGFESCPRAAVGIAEKPLEAAQFSSTADTNGSLTQPCRRPARRSSGASPAGAAPAGQKSDARRPRARDASPARARARAARPRARGAARTRPPSGARASRQRPSREKSPPSRTRGRRRRNGGSPNVRAARSRLAARKKQRGRVAAPPRLPRG